MPATISPLQRNSTASRVIFEVALGVLFGGGAVLLSAALALWLPEVSLFALAYPLALIGTLYEHWTAGVIAGLICLVPGWLRVTGDSGAFPIDLDTGLSIVMVHAASIVVTVAFALVFRRAIRVALTQRDGEIERGAIRMQELEHRTKNNLALVVSILQAQKRQETDAKISKALDLARARINSFARAYANLVQRPGEGGHVAMKVYLEEVVAHFADGGLPENVVAKVRAADCLLPREVAVGIGLFVNEALTNSAKHAFPDDRPGRIAVKLDAGPDGWDLSVDDHGVGYRPSDDGENAERTGSRLMQAFAQQARATITRERSSHGTRLRLSGRSAQTGG